MRWASDISVLMGIVLPAAVAQPSWALAAPFPAPQGTSPNLAVLHRATDSGVSIVRMPPRLAPNTSSATPATDEKPKPRPSEPEQLQGRVLKLPVKLGNQPNSTQNGFLGV